MPQFIRKSYKYACRGLGLANPPDLLPEGLYPILHNARVDQAGSLTARPPLKSAASAAAASPILTVRRLNDPTTGSFSRICSDAAGNLLAGTTALAVKDTGWSGNPTQMVPFRPLQSAAPWMYVNDSARSRKINVAGTVQSIGIVPPNVEATISPGIPNYINVADFDPAIPPPTGTAGVASWSSGGTAGAGSAINRFNTTISQVIYDSGTPGSGWCSIVLAVTDSNAQPGAFLLLNSAEIVKIHDVYQPIVTTTIQGISYDSGTSGLCSVVLTVPTLGLARDSVVKLNTELVRILSVTIGQDGVPSFRCSTTGTHAAGETVTGYASIRVYMNGPHSAGETATGIALASTIGAGIGYLTSNGVFDLSSASGRPVTQADYFHVSVLVDHPENIIEGRFEVDLSDGTFSKNYLYYPFQQSDLQANALGSLTYYASQSAALQQQIVQEQSGQVGNSIPGSPYGPTQTQINQIIASQQQGVTALNTLAQTQTTPGTSQWTEFMVPISSLIRVGSDRTKTLANGVSIRIQLNVSASTVLVTSSWWVGGTFGLDSGTTGTPYVATYRYRSSVTGARSNPAPIVRSGIYINREHFVVTSLQVSSDPQVDTADVFVYGGFNNNWALAASVPNSGGGVRIDISNDALQVAEGLQFDNFMPFPTTDLPRSGVCNVVGTTVTWVSGDHFNTRWAPGSAIIIGGIVYTFYDSPQTTSQVQLQQSAGVQSGVAFQIPEATLFGSPLPYVCDGGDSNNNVMFATGDPNNPGILLWGNPNDPDSASDSHNVEVTSPSEPLLQPFVWNGQAYVYSSQRLFVISPSAPAGTQRAGFLVQEVPTAGGLFAPWFSCVGSMPFFGGLSGINAWSGGASPSLTDEGLYPLFPHQDVTRTTGVNGYLPVDYTVPKKLRLFWADNELYFLYQDTAAAQQLMRYDFSHGAGGPGGWFPYGMTPEAYCVYSEEGQGIESLLVGGADGALYTFGSTGTETVACQVRTACLDMGDSRSQKLGTDALLDLAGTVSATIYFDNFVSNVSIGTVASATARGQKQMPLAYTALTLWRNIALNTSWSTSGVVLYEFQPAVELQPYLAPVFISQATDHGFTGFGHLREGWYAIISAAVVNVYAVVDGTSVLIAAVPSTAGLYQKVYLPAPPLKGKLFLYMASSADGSAFTLYPDESIVSVKEWGSAQKYAPFRPWQGMMNG